MGAKKPRLNIDDPAILRIIYDARLYGANEGGAGKTLEYLFEQLPAARQCSDAHLAELLGYWRETVTLNRPK